MYDKGTCDEIEIDRFFFQSKTDETIREYDNKQERFYRYINNQKLVKPSTSNGSKCAIVCHCIYHSPRFNGAVTDSVTNTSIQPKASKLLVAVP